MTATDKKIMATLIHHFKGQDDEKYKLAFKDITRIFENEIGRVLLEANNIKILKNKTNQKL